MLGGGKGEGEGAPASLRTQLIPPRCLPLPAAPGTPISTSARREAPVKSRSERPALGSGTEGLCSLQPRGQRVIINRGPGGSTAGNPPEGRAALPPPDLTPGWQPSGVRRRRSPRCCFPSRALRPHPAADPNPIPGGKARHGAHHHPREARHSPSAGLGICRRHNEHLCALKRLGRGGGSRPSARGQRIPAAAAALGEPRGPGCGRCGSPAGRGDRGQAGAAPREEEEPPWPVSQGRAGGRCRNSRLPGLCRGQVTGGERGRPG